MKRRRAEARVLSCPLVTCFFIFFLSCKGDRENNWISASGTIEAVEVTISSKLSGQVEKVLVGDGDKVKAGEMLAVIDSSSLEIQLDQASAARDLIKKSIADSTILSPVSGIVTHKIIDGG